MTDVLVCPRCGPAFGLILLADRIAERRVLEGRLGCSNCREQYAIRGGEVDLRTGTAPATNAGGDPGSAGSAADAGAGPSLEAARIAGLLGITQGPAYILLAGDAATHAEDVAALLEDVEVVAAHGMPSHTEDRPGVSHIVTAGLPLASDRMSGVAMTGADIGITLEEAARTVRPTGRLLVDPAPDDAEARLAPLGLRVLAREGAVVLAVRG